MGSTIAGPVILPDGTNPAHGRVIFEARAPILGASAILRGPVVAPITDGEISIELEGAADGTPYAVTVEYWSAAKAQLIRQSLPDVVPTGAAGPYTLADLATLTPDAGSADHLIIKRGDSLSLPVVWVDRYGRPLDLTGVSVASALLGPEGVVRPLGVEVLDAATGSFEIAMLAVDTAALPLGEHQIDIKFAVGARVVRTLTASITLLQEITP